MDRRSWPWKKKPSEKTVGATESICESVFTSVGIQVDQENPKDERSVQVSAESYTHFIELESQVKDLNEKLTSAHENLTSAQSEISAKEITVKQHAKVAEEAISGWEKAEAEALALNKQLETVTLLKHTAEEKASHLEGALKECTKQIRKVKEDGEQKLQDVVFAKTKQWEKISDDLQAKIADFEQKLLRASAENMAMSRALQERSSMLRKISEEKSEADAEIEMLKNNIQSCAKEIGSFDYELHVVSKELEIRNEEKNMCMRSTEAANKQHLEDIKKITRLEAECQRLRGLVRKKLPGPAALAQMKLEVENIGQDYGEIRMRRSPARGSSPQRLLIPEFALGNIQHCYKENEFLTSRLLAMEEETKMLKEALSMKNSEIQASHNMSAETMNKLDSIEAHVISFNHQKNPLKPTIHVDFENESNPQSLTTMSEDGIDEEGCSESWTTQISHFKKVQDKSTKEDNVEIMDDFLEMEKFACQSVESYGTAVSSNEIQDKMRTANDIAVPLADVPKNTCGIGESNLEPSKNHASSNEELPASKFTSDRSDLPLVKLQSRISSVFESQSEDDDVVQTLERIRCILQDAHEELPQQSASLSTEETLAAATHERIHHDEAMGDFTDDGVPSESNISMHNGTNFPLDQEMKNAIAEIYDFVVSFAEEAVKTQDISYGDHSLNKRIDDFSSSHNKILCNELSLHDFILALSCILSEVTELAVNWFGGKSKGGDINISECIDKVALSENQIDQHELKPDTLETLSSSGLENDGAIGQDIEMNNALQRISLEEFEQLKMDKEIISMDLDSCAKMLAETKQKLVETEQGLTELTSKLTASEKSNGLFETQLKCMAESYKSLELRTQEQDLHIEDLENEINVLRAKAEALENRLNEERHSHLDDLAKYTELQEKVTRDEKLSTQSLPPNTDADIKIKQEKELAATAERLAECQETIFLLGRQLKAMRPPEAIVPSPYNKHLISDCTMGTILNGSSFSVNSYHDEIETPASHVTQKTGGESPLDIYNYQSNPSYSEAGLFPRSPMNPEHQRHRLSEFSSSISSTTLSEKHGRGFSRFFSKGRKE